ncbi:MAG: hypothetical protein RLZZ350_960 [Verrucomicrobiota bacterium]|jgi:hypothetical protein
MNSTTPKPNDRLANVFALVFGAFLGLALLKFGNPCILEKLVDRPTNALEWLLNPWPVKSSPAWVFTFIISILAAVIALKLDITKPRPVVFWSVLSWYLWQLLFAGTHTVDSELTKATTRHFMLCSFCFAVGLDLLPRARSLAPFFLCLLAALVVVMAVGWQQHFGGLADTRKYFYAYIYPTLPSVPPEMLKKISSDRIYGTLFYPNALAGALLLLTPVSLALVWSWRERLTAGARGLLMALLGTGALGCLYWSKSKGGWLLALVLGLVALTRAQFSRRVKMILVSAILVVGLASFALRFAEYFEKGATSVSARGDYWRAAWQTACANPLYGTGPGTFAIPYAKIKNPESEMARLVHNDYLQQASDSGFIGAAAYLAFIVGSLWLTWRNLAREDWLKFSVWLGLLGWSLQSCVEFGLYIPSLAWPAFALFGWLLGSSRVAADARRL